MKRRVFYAIVLVLMAVSFNSCEQMFDECGMCEFVKFLDGIEEERYPPVEFCGANLVAKQFMHPFSITAPPGSTGTWTADWDCF